MLDIVEHITKYLKSCNLKIFLYIDNFLKKFYAQLELFSEYGHIVVMTQAKTLASGYLIEFF